MNELGVLIGSTAAAATDPAVIVGGILAGAVLKDRLHLLCAIVVMTVVLTVYIYYRNLEWLGRAEVTGAMVFARLAAYSIYGYAANGIARYIRREETSDGVNS